MTTLLRSHRTLLGILLLALVLRLALWSQPLHQPANDEEEYIAVARDLLEGRGWEFYNSYSWLRAPLYPLFLAGSLWLSQGNLHLAAWPNIVLSLGSIALIYQLTLSIAPAANTQSPPDAPSSRDTPSPLGDQSPPDAPSSRDTPSPLGDQSPPDAPSFSGTLSPPNPQSLPDAQSLSGAQSPGYGPAVLAAVLTTLLLTLNTFASLYMSETLFSFFFTAALLLLVVWQRGKADANTRGSVGSRRSAALLALAGVCYGLATLTRSLPLGFLPVVALWIVCVQWVGDRGATERATADLVRTERRRLSPGIGRCIMRSRSSLTSIGAAALFVACVLLTIAPWTLRNCRAYGRCILVETGFSYNMWAFNDPHESGETILRTLEQIPNPAERADEAMRRGMARLREDPTIVLHKLYPNWTYIWRVKPIQDRFLLWSYFADPPPILFLAALVFDDMLYVVILLAAVIGFTKALSSRFSVRHTPFFPLVLLSLWVMYVVMVGMLTHGEARYRHFFFPELISYAAVSMLPAYSWRRAMGDGRWMVSGWQWGLGGLLSLVLLYTVVSTYPWVWAQRGLGRSVNHMAGKVAEVLGDVEGAETAYRRALAAQRTADGWIALGELYREQGDIPGAEAAYQAAWRKERQYIAASARVGDILRLQGREKEARRAFVGNHVSEQAVLVWSWKHLSPAPTRFVNVGNGLDFGYVDGMYPDEKLGGIRGRWTNGRGWLRFAGPYGEAGFMSAFPLSFSLRDDKPALATPAVLRLRLAALQAHDADISVHICVAGHCQTVPVGREWRIVALPIPLVAQNDVIELRSPAFLAPDGRTLGVFIDWAAVSR